MKISLKPISEQVILITGASSGIGLGTARAAAAKGARVVLVARNEQALVAAAAGIRAKGGEADHAVADVGDIVQVRAAAAKAEERFGRIDTWVNCAGVAVYARLLDTPLDEHERLFRTNYFGVVNGATIAATHLRDKGGALITVGSIASDVSSPMLGAYAASKHAAKGFIESLRIELLADKAPIAVTLIKPSGINTPIGEHAVNHELGEALIPPPVYDPALVADAILFAACHVRREITVGGFGRAQVLFGTHFPALFERLAPLLVPLLFDPARKKTRSDSLDQPAKDGAERSATESGRRFSLFTSAQLHPSVTIGIGLVAAGALACLMTRGRRA